MDVSSIPKGESDKFTKPVKDHKEKRVAAPDLRKDRQIALLKELVKTKYSANYFKTGELLKALSHFFRNSAEIRYELKKLRERDVIMKMEKKVAAGAQFFQTQAVYDAKQFEEFVAQVKHLNVPIMLGIVLLKSAGMARFMNQNVAGVTVPEALIDEMDGAKDRKQKSVEIAARLIKETKDLCQGVHFMPLGWEKLVPSIMEEAGLL